MRTLILEQTVFVSSSHTHISAIHNSGPAMAEVKIIIIIIIITTTMFMVLSS